MPEHINIDVDFDNSIDVTQITSEMIRVPGVANFKGSRYVVRLKYTPYLGDPTKLPTIGGLTRVEGSTPNSGEFRIVEQALNLKHVSPNLLEFNSAQAGNSYSVNYWKYAELQDAEKVIFHDVLREIVKSENIDLSFTTTQILIGARSYFYFNDSVIIEPVQVAVTTSLSASTTYYVYCNEFKGTNFYEGVYSISTTAPSFSNTLLGWYNGYSKAICKFTTNASSQINFVESLGFLNPQLKILTLNDNYTLTQYEDYDIIECDPTSKAFSIILPSGSAVKGKKLFFKCKTNGGRVTIVGTIDGHANYFLDGINTYLKIYYNGIEWSVLDYFNYIDYGIINRSTYTNVEIGQMEVNYDNLTGVFTIGEVVREYTDVARTIPSGIYGIVILDTGSKLSFKNAAGGGIFTNDLYLKGDTSAATADVNEATTTKNLDANIFHGWNTTDDNYRLEMNFYTSSVGAGGFEVRGFDIVGASYNSNRLNIDNNTFKLQTAANGYGGYINDAGGGIVVDIVDYYYRQKLFVKNKL